ncbi:MAG: polyprenyl diphosphate synthase [Patescibacteria group bacterium]
MSAQITLPKNIEVPNHIVIMPDGDRRWARNRGLSASDGHKAGIANMIKLAQTARDWGIHTVSAWGLSTENWHERPKQEVDLLMKGIYKAMVTYYEDMQRDGVRFVHLGRKDRLPKFLLAKIAEIEEKTKNNTKHVFNVGLDYNGWDEFVRVSQKLVTEGIAPEKIDRKMIDAHMDTAGQPYPYIDLYIRTSGEQRTSGFMMWQADYAEFYWEPNYFPAFTPEMLREAIIDYSRRRRRFGGNDAMEHFTFDPHLVANLELKWWRLSKLPYGVSLMEYAIKHMQKQYNLSKELAKNAAGYMLDAIKFQDKNKLVKAKISLKKFYKLLKGELKLAFEPEIVASIAVELNKSKGESEELTKEHVAEVYRISLFQAAKAAHLRVLANVARNKGDWTKAEDYLEKYYSALKERVA